MHLHPESALALSSKSKGSCCHTLTSTWTVVLSKQERIFSGENRSKGQRLKNTVQMFFQNIMFGVKCVILMASFMESEVPPGPGLCNSKFTASDRRQSPAKLLSIRLISSSWQLFLQPLNSPSQEMPFSSFCDDLYLSVLI